jgi:hypothetical protein
LQQEDHKILTEAIEEDPYFQMRISGNQFRIVLVDYATRLGWIVEYFYGPGPDDTIHST